MTCTPYRLRIPRHYSWSENRSQPLTNQQPRTSCDNEPEFYQLILQIAFTYQSSVTSLKPAPLTQRSPATGEQKSPLGEFTSQRGCELARSDRFHYHCSIMTPRRFASFIALLIAHAAFADGPSDNQADKVRRIPPPRIKISDADRAELTEKFKACLA